MRQLNHKQLIAIACIALAAASALPQSEAVNAPAPPVIPKLITAAVTEQSHGTTVFLTIYKMKDPTNLDGPWEYWFDGSGNLLIDRDVMNMTNIRLRGGQDAKQLNVLEVADLYMQEETGPGTIHIVTPAQNLQALSLEGDLVLSSGALRHVSLEPADFSIRPPVDVPFGGGVQAQGTGPSGDTWVGHDPCISGDQQTHTTAIWGAANFYGGTHCDKRFDDGLLTCQGEPGVANNHGMTSWCGEVWWDTGEKKVYGFAGTGAAGWMYSACYRPPPEPLSHNADADVFVYEHIIPEDSGASAPGASVALYFQFFRGCSPSEVVFDNQIYSCWPGLFVVNPCLPDDSDVDWEQASVHLYVQDYHYYFMRMGVEALGPAPPQICYGDECADFGPPGARMRTYTNGLGIRTYLYDFLPFQEG